MKLSKKWLSVVAMSALVLGACGDGGGSSSSATADGSASGEQQSLTFNASSGVNDKHFWHRGFFQPLMDSVDEETGGKVSFNAFTSGELVGLGTEYDALTNGTIDVALTLMAPYDPQRFPYTEVVMLPLLESDSTIAAEAMKAMMNSDQEIKDGKTYYQIEFEDKGLVAFANSPTQPYVISTTNKAFDEVGDFSRDVRMRTASRVHEILSTNLGITSQSMPITDAFDALSRNALDGFFYNVPDWMAFGFDELIKHTIEGANFGHFVGHTAMTEETWAKLTPETQDIFRSNAERLIVEGSQLTKDETEENRQSNIDKGGEFKHLSEVPEDVRVHIEAAITKTWLDWIENLESQGHAGKEIAILWRDSLVEAGAEVPQEVMDIK